MCEITGMRYRSTGYKCKCKYRDRKAGFWRLGCYPVVRVQYRSDFSWQPQTRTVIIEDNKLLSQSFC